jgi:hypothetical protein
MESDELLGCGYGLVTDDDSSGSMDYIEAAI